MLKVIALCLLALACAIESDVACLDTAATSNLLLQTRLHTTPSSPHTIPVEHFWSQKNGNARRSAQAAFAATSNFAKPAWISEDRDGNPRIAMSNVVQQSPVIDKDYNIYLSSDSGKIHSFRVKDGRERWSVQLQGNAGSQVPTPVLLGNTLFAADSIGNLLALSTADGSEVWRSHYSDCDVGFGPWSLAGSGDIIVLAGSPKTFVSPTIYAVSSKDGRRLWSFPCALQLQNFMPAIVDDSVVFVDSNGGVHSLGLSDGKLKWQLPPVSEFAISTGGLAVGSNNIAYATSNLDTKACLPGTDITSCGNGLLRAIDLQTGQILWNRTFIGIPANNAPAVYSDASTQKFRVVIGLGRNPLLPCVGCEGIGWNPPFLTPIADVVTAVDGLTGSDVWSFQTPIWKSNAAAGSTTARMCWSEAFSNPSVDSNGTVYIGWKGGILFAIDGRSGRKLSETDVGSAFGGAPAIAPGVLVAASCDKLLAFHDVHDKF